MYIHVTYNQYYVMYIDTIIYNMVCTSTCIIKYILYINICCKK